MNYIFFMQNKKGETLFSVDAEYNIKLRRELISVDKEIAEHFLGFVKKLEYQEQEFSKTKEMLAIIIKEFDPDIVRGDPLNNNRTDAGARLIIKKAKEILTILNKE